MKILFVGLGSIGQRHLVNAKKIFKGSEFYALRIKNKNLLIKNTKASKIKDLGKFYKIKIVKDYKAALKIKPNLTFICNPSSKHLGDAIKFAETGSNLFIEKPLGRSKKLEKQLIKIIKRKKIITMVGYQTRFHPLVMKLKKIIKNNSYGKIVYANLNYLTFLPHHHKYENYENSYAAQRNLGGGVIDGLIHEIDLITHFFGLPYKQNAIKNNSGLLKINCEDSFSSLMKFNVKKNIFDVFLRLSYVQSKEERKISILFEKALIKVCLVKNDMKIYSNKNFLKKRIKIKIDRNKLFVDQLEYLKKCLVLKKNPPTSLLSNQKTQKLFLDLVR